MTDNNVVPIDRTKSLPTSGDSKTDSALLRRRAEMILSTAPFDLDHIEIDDRLEDAISVLEASLAKSEIPEIARMLDMVTETLQVDLPSEAATEIYYSILRDIPADLLMRSAKEVLKNHVYPTMPKPADFYKAVEADIKQRQTDLRWFQLAADRLEAIGL